MYVCSQQPIVIGLGFAYFKLYVFLLFRSTSLTAAGQVEDAVGSEIMKSSETLHTDEEARLSDTTRPASQPTVVVIDTVVNDTQDTGEESDNVNARPVSDLGDAPVTIDTVVNGLGDTHDNSEGCDNVNARPVGDQGDARVIVDAGDDSKVIVTVKTHDTNGDTHPTLDCCIRQLAVKPCDDDVTVAGSDVIVDPAQLLGPEGDLVGSVNGIVVVDETATDDLRFTNNEDTDSPVDANVKDCEDTMQSDHVDTKLKDREETTVSDHGETNSPNQEDTNLKHLEDTTLPDHTDTKLEDREDTKSPDREDTKLNDQENRILPDHVDTNLNDGKDTNLPDQVDANLTHKEDTDLTDCKDIHLSGDADANLKDRADMTLSDHVETNLKDEDSNLKHQEDTNLPDHTNMTDCVDTNLFVEKETILQDADRQHSNTVVVPEKVTDVNENCESGIVTEKMTDRGDTFQVTGDDIQKVDVAMESLDINDKVENCGFDIEETGGNSVPGEKRSGIPTGIVVTSNNAKHADNNTVVSTSVHSATGEETPVDTTTIPACVPDISVTTCVNSDSNDVGVTTAENTSSCQRVDDDASGSNGRTSPLVTVSDTDGHVIDTTPTVTDIDQLNAMTANLHLSATSSTSTPLNCRSVPRIGIDGDASLTTQLELDVFAETPEKVSPVKGHHVRSPRTVSMKDGDYKARSCHRDGSFIGQLLISSIFCAPKNICMSRGRYYEHSLSKGSSKIFFIFARVRRVCWEVGEINYHTRTLF